MTAFGDFFGARRTMRTLDTVVSDTIDAWDDEERRTPQKGRQNNTATIASVHRAELIQRLMNDPYAADPRSLYFCQYLYDPFELDRPLALKRKH